MRLLAFLLGLLLALPALAQPTRPLPPWTPPSDAPPRTPPPPENREPRTYHDSAPLAYAISAGATVGLVGLGALLYVVLPEGDPYTQSFTPNYIGVIIMGVGAMGGPSAGNASLGAERDVMVATGLKVAGAATPMVALAVAMLTCQSECSPALGNILLYGAAGAGVAAFAAGTVYDLVTIPRNARDASERLGRPRRPAVTLAPAPGGAQAALRIPL